MNRARLQNQLQTMMEISEETGCWIWLGQISNSGHGSVTIRDDELGGTKRVSAATASYLAFISEIPASNLVRQTCGNRLCINPEHLETFAIPQ